MKKQHRASFKPLWMATVALALMVGCGGQNLIQRKKTEYVFEMDASNWLLSQQKVRHAAPLFECLVKMPSPGADLDAHPFDSFEALIQEMQLSDSLPNWFPNYTSEMERYGSMLAALRRGYELSVQKVAAIMEHRYLSQDPIVIDKNSRIHILDKDDVTESQLVHLLTTTGNLGFYETYNLSEIMPSLEQLHAATVVVENGDTTFNVLKMLGEAKDNLGLPIYQLNQFSIDRPIIGNVLEKNKATIEEKFQIGLRMGIFPQNAAFAWAQAAFPEYPQYAQWIAIRTNPDGSPRLSGDAVVTARMDYEPNSTNPMVSISMSEEGAAEWRRMTKFNIGRAIAIVMDGQVLTFPVVQGIIEGGRTQITGNFTVDEARNLAAAIQSGAYPARTLLVDKHPAE